MRKSFLPKKTTSLVLVLAVFCLLFASCTNLLEGLGLPKIEDYWMFDRFEEEDRELIKGKWILKKVGFESWNEVDNPYVDTEDIQQTSHIESLQFDFEGEHMTLTFNFNQPTLVQYATFVDNGPVQIVDTWKTSLTIPHYMSMTISWEEYLSTDSGDSYEYNGETFYIYDSGIEEDICNCSQFSFYCLYSVKNIITDEKGKINRLIMDYYPSYNANYDYEFERE